MSLHERYKLVEHIYQDTVRFGHGTPNYDMLIMKMYHGIRRELAEEILAEFNQGGRDIYACQRAIIAKLKLEW